MNEPIVLQTIKPEDDVPKKTHWLIKFLITFTLFILVIGAIAYWLVGNLNEPPKDFPSYEHITIEPGTDVKTITEILQEKRVVKSKDFLYYSLVFLYDPTSIKASTYVFDRPLTAQEVAKRLTEGDFDTNLIRFTHLEGERASQIAQKAGELLPNFDEAEFTEAVETKQLEGKLFPETYFIPISFSDEELLDLFTETFSDKISNFLPEIESNTLSLDEIIILASIIEREANSIESMKLVSSILQNRLDIDMPLQADASIEYVLDKPLSELTPDDLKVDSPYNTYLNKGLPPTPIGNPGLDAILAVLEPTESEYFYYLTDGEGEFHYAETYKEHLRNIAIYLK